MKTCLILLFLAMPLFAQSNTGELRVKVTDPAGLGVKSSVVLVSEVNQYHKKFETDDSGTLVARLLPFGMYQLEVQQQGFAPYSGVVEVRSAISAEQTVRLSLASVNTSVNVTDTPTLIDPHGTGTIDRIGTDTIETRVSSLPGRSLQDLVNSQPGWLYEGNAVLHPRGAEYQTQFVIDGIPLTDNRSPGFGPEIEADDVQSMSVFTAGIPAEYGRKMGGIVEVNSKTDARQGLHGQAVLSGGSFDTAGAYADAQYAWGKNVLGVSADGDMTGHYLNPVVVQNYTNNGTTGDFAANYSRDFTENDRVSMTVRHEFSRFQVPNELIQQTAGQLQTRNNFETMGIISYTHIFSPNVVADLRGMVRDGSEGFSSNANSTPIIAFQNNSFREGYFKGTISIHHGIQEWKLGVESDATYLHEQFSDIITDPSQFDPGTPTTFSFTGNRPDLEQSVFVQDLIRLRNWTVSLGLRWDHYQLIENQNAVSPRIGISRYFARQNLVIHAAYDRVFQTPDSDNILLSSSPEVISLNPSVLRLPVKPSQGNYYELGFTKGFLNKLSIDGNAYIRNMNNFADDDLLLDTGVSFPIAFLKGHVYGAEAKLNIPDWGHFSGFVSYSYMVGSTYFPVTGGLFLGDEATNANTQLTGRSWNSQDQRNTVRSRVRYQVFPRLWFAGGVEYGTGLPFDFTGTEQEAVAQYGQQIVDRVNFARGRVKPSLAISASVGALLWTHDTKAMRLQADLLNINNRLNVIDFSGLFSGNAIAPPRSYSLRLTTDF